MSEETEMDRKIHNLHAISLFAVLATLLLNVPNTSVAFSNFSRGDEPSSRLISEGHEILTPQLIQAAVSIGAEAVELGQPGLSFRYVQTFGTTNVPYFTDGNHLFKPHSVWVDNAGNVYVTEANGHRLLKYNSAGVFQFSIGTPGSWGPGDYEFHAPLKVTVDVSGTIYVADTLMRRIKIHNSAGVFTGQLGETWVPGTDNMHFTDPKGVAVDIAGKLYVADTLNHRIQIFDNAHNYVATMGVTGVPGTDNAHFNEPEGIAFDSAGNIYVADFQNHRIQKFNSSRVYVATLGESGVPGSDNAHFNLPNTVVVDAADNLYIADIENQRVQRFTSNLVYSDTLGVTGVIGTDNAHFQYPTGVAVNRTTGEIYVADIDNHRVQVFNNAFVYQRTIGLTDVPYTTDSSHFNSPSGVAVSSDGSIYLTEVEGHRLIKLNAAGVPQWAVGQAGLYGEDNAHFKNPHEVAVDAVGRIYVADTFNDRIQIFNPNGTYSATFGSGGTGNYQFVCPTGVTFNPLNGDIYVTDHCNHRIQVFDGNRVYKATLGVTGIAGSDNAHLYYPSGVAVDTNGNIYVADRNNHRVQKCILSGASGTCTTFAGETGVEGDDFGHMSAPVGVAVDSAGRVHVVSPNYVRVQVFDSNGVYLTTIGGSWGSRTGELRDSLGVALDSAGYLYITDQSRIQKYAPGVPGWLQVNINGFGDRDSVSVTALEVFNGKLYAGASKRYWESGPGNGSIWRLDDLRTWTPVLTDTLGPNNGGIHDMIEFSGQLYVGTYNATDGGEVWRSANGINWTRVVTGGFGNAARFGVSAFGVFSGKLYACVESQNPTEGVEIWRSGTGNSGDWIRVVENGLNNDAGNRVISSFFDLGGFLYAAVVNENAGAEIWRSSDGVTWQPVVANEADSNTTGPDENGFGDSGNVHFGSFAEFGNMLYLGTRNNATGAQLWRSSDGTVWTQVEDNGFGNGNNVKLESLRVFDGYLYAVLYNEVTGAEVWRSADGITWQPVSAGGWGDSNNFATLWGNATAVFNHSMFIGTWNFANGGELWQFLHQLYLPLVRR